LFIIVRPKIYDEFQWVMVQLPISALIRHLGVFRLRLRPMFSKSFEEMGIPQGYGFKQLLFSLVANALVLHTCSASDNWRPERLLYRHLAWDRYRIIANPDDLISQESPFLHSSKPLLAYVSTQHRFSLDEEGKECHSGNWHGLYIVNLEKGSETQSVSEESITLPVGTKRGWICEIVSFGDSGLFVKAALSKNETVVEYFVAELDDAQNVKPIATLLAVFMWVLSAGRN
jgi:hypothetical protein